MLWFKPGAVFSHVHPRLLEGLVVLCRLFDQYSVSDLTITSGTDGVHKKGSFHGTGRAVDVRSKTLPPAKVEAVVRAFRATEDADFDLLWEFPGQANEHLHLEYDPKPQGNAL